MTSGFARAAITTALAGLAALAPVTASADVNAQENREFVAAAYERKQGQAREKAVRQVYEHAAAYQYTPEQCEVYKIDSRKIGFEGYVVTVYLWCTR